VVQVNLKLFAPDPHKARTILLFIFRDRTKTPLQRLIQTWEEDLAQMWASIAKPTQYEGNAFTDFFEVRSEINKDSRAAELACAYACSDPSCVQTPMSCVRILELFCNLSNSVNSLLGHKLS